MRQFLKKGLVRITFDRAFRTVIAACRKPRPGQDGTWITAEMQEAYCALHDLGYAHSVEVWQGEALAGGLYGVSLGRAFFGESMFSRCRTPPRQPSSPSSHRTPRSGTSP